MAYDPQANRRRPRPADDGPAPVDALLGATPPPVVSEPDDPPPTPAVTPEPADPPSDALLLNTGLAAAIGAAITLLALRHLWNRRRRMRTEESPD